MENAINPEDAFSYAELLEILSYTDEKDVKKLPKKLILFLEKNSLSTYQNHINPELSLQNQKLSTKTVSLLILLTLNYWCENNEQKEQIKNKLKENEIKKTKKLKEKYSYDKIFDKANSSDEYENINDNIHQKN